MGDSVGESLDLIGDKMAPGLVVVNESSVPILFVLSQLTPLYW